MLPTTATRVEESTARAVNQDIRGQTARDTAYFAARPELIARRLRGLDAEWDIERTLETNAAAFSLAGLALGAFVDRRFLALPAAVGLFLLQHAIQGWCPPLPILRRLGFRTAREIHEERTALKALRGDFRAMSEDTASSARERSTRALELARI